MPTPTGSSRRVSAPPSRAAPSSSIALVPTSPTSPANPRLVQGEATVNHPFFLYLRPDANPADVDATFKAFADLSRKHGIRNGYNVVQAITSEDLPLTVVTVPAKSLADFYAENEKQQATLGTEGQALLAKLGTMMRSVKQYDAAIRTDLSYLPAASGR